MVVSFDTISFWRKFRWESWWFVPSLVSHVWQLSNPQSLIGLYPWWLLPYIENSSPQQFEPRIIADRKSTGWNYNSTVCDYTRLYLYRLITNFLWTEDPKPTMNQLWSMMIVSVWTTHLHAPLKNGPQLPSVALLLHGNLSDLSYPFCWAYRIPHWAIHVAIKIPWNLQGIFVELNGELASMSLWVSSPKESFNRRSV